jgi:hypothetical protein
MKAIQLVCNDVELGIVRMDEQLLINALTDGHPIRDIISKIKDRLIANVQTAKTQDAKKLHESELKIFFNLMKD